MFCEACGVKGLDKKDCKVDAVTGLFLGPCCVDKKDVTVGLELSSTKGLKAYLKVDGLSIEYKKAFNELPITNKKNIEEGNGFPEGLPVGEA